MFSGEISELKKVQFEIIAIQNQNLQIFEDQLDSFEQNILVLGNSVQLLFSRQQNNDSSSKLYRVVGSSYSDCGASGDSIHISGISVSPDTISIPGTIVITASITNTANISAPIKADVSVKVKVSIITIDLCAEGLINCSFADVCADASATGISLCPVPAGTISVNQLSIPIPAIPSVPVDKVTVEAKAVLSQNGAELGCGEATVKADFNQLELNHF
ncbi:ganglioside GM2 activator-like isoform X1 [Symsagittifera roscoffensis]|uniref:ganglioside GM2 activator-like isoform X1 n=1 Tax=Symsagittifera roscoffensis TaxID=84072 RepID=UPI00307CC012